MISRSRTLPNRYRNYIHLGIRKQYFSPKIYTWVTFARVIGTLPWGKKKKTWVSVLSRNEKSLRKYCRKKKKYAFGYPHLAYPKAYGVLEF